jgi:acetyl/propionyl-CoA carboxylase alpha subunit
LVTGLDLVRLQLIVAAGDPLPAEAMTPTIDGHAIEVRLYAEDATNGFLPTTGSIRRFEIPDSVRVDAGVESGSVVSPYYDAMLAKVVSHAPTRHEAATSLAAALRRSRIHGVTTNRDLLARILTEPDFLAGATDTAYLERHDPADLGGPLLDEPAELAHLLAAAIALQARNRSNARVQATLPSGWRNNASQPQRLILIARDAERVITYSFGRHGSLTAAVDDQPVDVIVHSARTDIVDATIDGVRRQFDIAVASADGPIDVDSSLGSSSYDVVPRFPDPLHAVAHGSLVAPMPGSVVRVLVEPGAAVAKGQPLVVLEAMKMEHTVASPADCTVTEVQVAAGQQVDAGAVLVVVDDTQPPA